MKSVLDIKISKEELENMTPQERDIFYSTILDAMTPKQLVQMVKIGKKVIVDDIKQRATKRSRTALRTLARSVNVTVNEV